MMLEQERRRAEEEAARLEAERQAALLAKEELARQAESQLKTQEQLVSALMTPRFDSKGTKFIFLRLLCTSVCIITASKNSPSV